MNDNNKPPRKIFFYSLDLKAPLGAMAGTSCNLQPVRYYFSTQKKLELWSQANQFQSKDAIWGMHEISIQCAKELVALSKKKPKCQECGK